MLQLKIKSEKGIEMAQGETLKEDVISLIEKYDNYVMKEKNNPQHFRDFLAQDKKLHFVLNEDFSGFLFNTLFEYKKEHLFIRHILPISKFSRTLGEPISSKIHWLHLKTKDLSEDDLQGEEVETESYFRQCNLLNALIKQDAFHLVHAKRFDQSTTFFSMVPLSVLNNNRDYFQNLINKDPMKFCYDFVRYNWKWNKNPQKVEKIKAFFLDIGTPIFKSLVPVMQETSKILLEKEDTLLYTVMRKQKNQQNLIFLMACFQSNFDLVELLINRFNYVPCEQEKELMNYYSKSEDIPVIIQDANKQSYVQLNNEQKLKIYILKKEEKNIGKMLSQLCNEERENLWNILRDKESKEAKSIFKKEFKEYHEQLGMMAIMSCSLPVLSELLKYNFPFSQQHYDLFPFVLKNTKDYEKQVWEKFRYELKKYTDILSYSFICSYMIAPFIITENRKELKKQESFINDIVFNYFFLSQEFLQNIDIYLKKVELNEVSDFFKFYLSSHVENSGLLSDLKKQYKIDADSAFESLYQFEKLKPSAKKRIYEEQIFNMYESSFDKNKKFTLQDFENMMILFGKIKNYPYKKNCPIMIKIAEYLTIKMEQRILNESGIVYNKDNKITNRI